LLVNTLENFQGTHLLGASRGHLSDSVIFLFLLSNPHLIENMKFSCCEDSRSYCIRRTLYLQTVVWNSFSQYAYLLFAVVN